MQAEIPSISYTVHELRRLCRQVTRVLPEIVLDGHRIRVHDMHPDLVLAGQSVHEHQHSFYEGHLFLDGGGIYLTGGEQWVGPAGTLLHGPHAPHAWGECKVTCLRLLIWFSMDPMVAVPRPAAWPICPDLHTEISLMLDDAHAALPGWHHRAIAHVTVALSRMLSIADWPQSPEPFPVPETNLVAIIDQLFRDNFPRQLGLTDVAAHVGMSERTLSRQFAEMTGETVMDRLLNLRMEHAATLLTDTTLSTASIGAEIGMPDPSYFSRRFRLYFNTTPAGYRKGITKAKG